MTQNPKKNPTVLVIEDSTDSRTLFRVALEGDNYEVVTVPSAIEALDLLASGSCPDLILLDLSLPQMSGAEFMVELRKQDHCSNIKVIVVSGWDDLAKKAEDVGAVGYLRKPFELHVLAREVRRHLT